MERFGGLMQFWNIMVDTLMEVSSSPDLEERGIIDPKLYCLLSPTKLKG